MLTEAELDKAFTDALGGKNDTLFLAIHDRLQRHPETIADCREAYNKMSRDERVFYGLADWSDDSKRFCPQCQSDHRGVCPTQEAATREARNGTR